MKKQKIKLSSLNVKSLTIFTTAQQNQIKSQKSDGGYTWVG